MNTNNEVELVGRVDMRDMNMFSTYGEDLYRINIITTRYSGRQDIVPVVIPERLWNHNRLSNGQDIKIIGQYRTNKHDSYVLALIVDEDDLLSFGADVNSIYLKGTIINRPRVTVSYTGKKFAIVKLKVDRNIKMYENCRCIAWNDIAEIVSKSGIGTNIWLEGRLQSRTFINDSKPNRTIREVSIHHMGVEKYDRNKGCIRSYGTGV